MKTLPKSMEKFKLNSQDKYHFYKLERNKKRNRRGQVQYQWDTLHKMIQINKMKSETSFDDLYKDTTLSKSVDDFIKKAYGQIPDVEEQDHPDDLTIHENAMPKINVSPDKKINTKTLNQIQDSKMELNNKVLISTRDNDITSRKVIKVNSSENSKNSNILTNNSRRTHPIQEKKEDKQHSYSSKNGPQPSTRQTAKECEINKNQQVNNKLTQNVSPTALDLKLRTNDEKEITHLKTPQKNANSDKDELCTKSHQKDTLILHPKGLLADKKMPIFPKGHISTGKLNTPCQQIFLPAVLMPPQNNSNIPITNRKSISSLRKIAPSHTTNHIGSGSGDPGYITNSLNSGFFVNGRHRGNLEAPMIYYNSPLLPQMCRQERVNDIQNPYMSYMMNEHLCPSMTHLAPQGFLDWETNLSVNTSNCQLPNQHFIPPYDENTPFWDLTWIPTWNDQATYSANQTNTPNINDANKICNQSEPSKTYFGPAETILHSKPGMIRHTGFNVKPALITQSHC
ncbi:uncharacterized protein LOC124165442 [Ischnura elegans]|uniref:uncharacterized protein LOC124165442 n=1 Tax=Ischnura elegans TaxID=197161 RepID=UPI001ED89E36|nr:uncharacterized protein LOC124165442 [Ischnura elegans]